MPSGSDIAEAMCLQSKFSEETMLAKGTRDGRRFQVQEERPKVIGIMSGRPRMN